MYPVNITFGSAQLTRSAIETLEKGVKYGALVSLFLTFNKYFNRIETYNKSLFLLMILNKYMLAG